MNLIEGKLELIANHFPKQLSDEEKRQLKILLERAWERSRLRDEPTRAERKETLQKLIKKLTEFQELCSFNETDDWNMHCERWIEDELFFSLTGLAPESELGKAKRALSLLDSETAETKYLLGLLLNVHKLRSLLVDNRQINPQ